MNQVSVRFYADLNDHLAPEQRGVEQTHRFRGQPTVKDLIESLGPPHTEVALILVDGDPVDFDQPVMDGQRISVFPLFRHLALGTGPRPLMPPLAEPKFVLDGHLGRLAGYLRMLGFDSRYRNDIDDAELAQLSSGQRRILLTRDRELLKRRSVEFGYFVRATDPIEQLVEVVRRFDLMPRSEPFARCLACNGRLVEVDKAQVAQDLPEEARRHYKEFRRCRRCGKVYWPGSHVDQMQELIEWLDQEVGPGHPDRLP